MTSCGTHSLRTPRALLNTLISSSSLSFATMFTVKASYKHETRKFTFDSDSFPTYTQLHEQVRSRHAKSLFAMLIYPSSSSLESSPLLIL